MKNYIIIGNGTAGANAAVQIRKRDKEGSIIVFSRENYPFYYRPRLPDYIAGKVKPDDFIMHRLSQYENWNIDLRLGEDVSAVDPQKKEICSSQSGTLHYDELLLAVGSDCFIPPVPGNDKIGVVTLRTIKDADALISAAAKTKSAVIVGGGLLGLEAGWALIQLGLKVEIIEFMDRLLPRQLDAEKAALLKEKLMAMGFSFHLPEKVKEVPGSGTAEGIVLESGKYIEGGIVLFSAGVRPNLKLARSIGLEIDKAIKVDEYMRTSIPGIWAAGDAVEFNGQPCGLWPIAMAEGNAAGASMAGELSSYIPKEPLIHLKIAGIDLMNL